MKIKCLMYDSHVYSLARPQLNDNYRCFACSAYQCVSTMDKLTCQEIPSRQLTVVIHGEYIMVALVQISQCALFSTHTVLATLYLQRLL